LHGDAPKLQIYDVTAHMKLIAKLPAQNFKLFPIAERAVGISGASAAKCLHLRVRRLPGRRPVYQFPQTLQVSQEKL
jgi:hypothetical protein